MTASTLTTVAVFVPIALVGGFVGQLFAPFAITVTVALLASLLVSLTVMPVLAYWFLKPPALAPSEAGGARGGRGARNCAAGCSGRTCRSSASPPPGGTAGHACWLGVLVFARARSAWPAGWRPTSWTTPARTPLPSARSCRRAPGWPAPTRPRPGSRRCSGVRRGVKTLPGHGRWRQHAVCARRRRRHRLLLGARSPRTPTPRRSGGACARSSTPSVRRRARSASVPGRAVPPPTSSRWSCGPPIRDALTRAAEAVRSAVAGTPGIEDVTTGLATRVPRVEVTVDRVAAARAGLTEAAVGQLVAQVYRGAPLGQVTLDGAPQNVVLRQRGPAPADRGRAAGAAGAVRSSWATSPRSTRSRARSR